MPSVAWLTLLSGVAYAADPEQMIADYSKTEAGFLSICAGAGESVSVLPPDARWNVSGFTRVELDVENPGDTPAHVSVKLFSTEGTDWFGTSQNVGFIRPRTRKVFNVFIYRPPEDRDAEPLLKQFVGMSGLPGGLLAHWRNLDTKDVRALTIDLVSTDPAQTLRVYSIKATHPIVPAVLREMGDGFFPFVDRFGQYKFADWPGKTTDEAALKTHAAEEHQDLAAHGVSATWDRFGGWAAGPLKKSTGFFRTEKIDGKWWLIDPDGRLFWSHGVDCVGYDSGRTPVTGREKFFELLPDPKGAFADAYMPAESGQSFNFVKANLRRTFGGQWKTKADELAHRRLASWGLNTIGAWSETELEQAHRLPYTPIIHLTAPYAFDKAFDVYNPNFARHVMADIAAGTKGRADDAWIVGFFVDNELEWGNHPEDFVAELLRARPCETKRELIRVLRKTYETIDELNADFGTAYASFDAVETSREKLKSKQVPRKFDTFYTAYCDRYFEAVGTALKKHAPRQLYLGCRMHVSNDLAVNAAAQWCDVLSFNLYRADVNDFRPPGGADRPVLVSEFHFGTLDRGFFGAGLQPASDQEDRSDKYRYYVGGALRNPLIVGTHWFAYCPQPLTGRGDGENNDTGLFDTANRPYPELREAVREMGGKLYETR